MGNARRYKTCSSCGVNDHFARVWEILMLQYQIPDPKLPTRYGRKEYTKTLNGHRRDSRRVASDKIHVQIHLPNHETFTTPTSTSQRSSNMTHPLIMIVASDIPWKFKYTASLLPARQGDTLQPYHFPRQAQHSLKSSLKQTPQQHATSCPLYSTLTSARC